MVKEEEGQMWDPAVAMGHKVDQSGERESARLEPIRLGSNQARITERQDRTQKITLEIEHRSSRSFKERSTYW